MRTIIVTLLAGLALGSTATAAVGWRVFASASDSGDYGTLASASASVVKPKALAARIIGTGGPFELSWYFTCEGEAHPLSGQLVALTIAGSAKCSVSGMGDGANGGSIRVQLLKR